MSDKVRTVTNLKQPSAGFEAEEDGSKKSIEVFKDHPIKELRMSFKWSMWEHYESPQNASFENQMAIVCWFNDYLNFAKCWNTVPHSSLSNFFYSKESGKVPM